jgi:hypothetical protein
MSSVSTPFLAHTWQAGLPPGIRLGGCYDVKTPGCGVSALLPIPYPGKVQKVQVVSQAMRHIPKCPMWWARPGPGEWKRTQVCHMGVFTSPVPLCLILDHIILTGLGVTWNILRALACRTFAEQGSNGRPEF